MHPNGWSEDLAWGRNRTSNRAWLHWFTLIASMGSENTFSGTIRAISE